jgi:hypothetical protein
VLLVLAPPVVVFASEEAAAVKGATFKSTLVHAAVSHPAISDTPLIYSTISDTPLIYSTISDASLIYASVSDAPLINAAVTDSAIAHSPVACTTGKLASLPGAPAYLLALAAHASSGLYAASGGLDPSCRPDLRLSCAAGLDSASGGLSSPCSASPGASLLALHGICRPHR